MTDITVPERRVAAIDLIDEAIAALEVTHQVIDSHFAHQPMGMESASVLYDTIVKLRPLRQHLNKLHGAA
jgi:hypothetical protein